MTQIRLSPSGQPIANVFGGPLSFGHGARLRLAEAQSTMSGTDAIPAVADLICPDGFGQTDAIVLTLDNPKQFLYYRANLALDIVNTSTNNEGEVVLYLDVSIDGGVTYTNRAKNVHLIPPGVGATAGRQAQVWMPMLSGGSLGLDDATPAPSVKLRARASMPLGTAGTVHVSSLAASDGGTPVTGLNGTIHMELEECF